MANNRLYIRDVSTGEEFMLAKSFGEGWQTRETNEGEKSFEERFNEWLSERDSDASLGNCKGNSCLVLIRESDGDYLRTKK